MTVYAEAATASLVDTLTPAGPIGPSHSVDVSLSGTFVATIALQRYIGGAWVTVTSYTTAVEDTVLIGARGMITRLIATAYTSGTAVATLQAGDEGAVGKPFGAARPSSTTLITGDIEIGAVEIKNATDDTRAKVLVASTAAVATDTALIVAPHPSSKGPITIADGDDAAQGITSGAKVITDANGTIQQYLRGLVAAQAALTTVTHASVATSTTSGLALAANASARYRCFQNKDATITITLNCGGTAVAGTGIVLLAGQTYEMALKAGNLFAGIVNAIAASGTPALSVTEGV